MVRRDSLSPIDSVSSAFRSHPQVIPLFLSYLCIRSFRKLRAFAVGGFFDSFAPSRGRRYRPQTTMPSPTLLGGIGISLGSPLPTSHLPWHPARSLPCSSCETRTERCRWRVPGCPFHSLWLPSFDRGYVRLTSIPFSVPQRCTDVGLLSSLDVRAAVGWLTSQTRFVRVQGLP